MHVLCEEHHCKRHGGEREREKEREGEGEGEGEQCAVCSALLYTLYHVCEVCSLVLRILSIWHVHVHL